MYRLQLLNMCSRETVRLPVAKIRELLECVQFGDGLTTTGQMPGLCAELPIEVREAAPALPPSEKFVVYLIEPHEPHAHPDAHKTQFIMVVVQGFGQETVIEKGWCSGLERRNGYVAIHGKGDKIGWWAIYLASPSISGLTTWIR